MIFPLKVTAVFNIELKNPSDEAFKALSLYHFNAVSTIWIHAEISIKQCKTFWHICESKDDKVFFDFAPKITEI